jgi:thiamine-monophosphate kinase
MDEFSFIAELLSPLAVDAGALALKDDAALVKPGPGRVFAITKDALIEGVHFTGRERPALIARKLLRVNLSDLAAMGAVPRGYFLALMLPERYCRPEWLQSFAAGLAEDQRHYAMSLLGGDTTRSPNDLCLSLTLLGEVENGTALLRAGARAGDDVYVSGTIGDAALGLLSAQGLLDAPASARDWLHDRYLLPQPRLALGRALRGQASACMDISDGLMQDTGQLCRASNLGARLLWPSIPLSEAALSVAARVEAWRERILAGGDDYELLFTAHPARRGAIEALALEAMTPVTRIGTIGAQKKVTLEDRQGNDITPARSGYRHF